MTPTIEQHLRTALAEQAARIKAEDLSPARPPSLAFARPVRRHFWIPVLAAGALAAATLLAVLFLWHPQPAQQPAEVPAGPVGSTSPTPTRTKPRPAPTTPARIGPVPAPSLTLTSAGPLLIPGNPQPTPR